MMQALERAIGVLAAVLLFAMMMLTFADVVGRTVLDAPVPAAYDLTELAMGLSIFVALPLTSWHREHITIRLFGRFIPRRVRTVQLFLVDVVSAAVLALFAWRLWIQADKLAASNNKMMLLGAPIAPFVYCMAVMAGLAVLLVLAAACLRPAVRQEAAGAGPGEPV